MYQRIRSGLRQAAVHVLALLAPPTGRRRAAIRVTARTPLPSRTASGLRLIVRTVSPPRLPARPHPYRWWADRDDGPVLDSPSPLVRPYFLAHERRLAAPGADQVVTV